MADKRKRSWRDYAKDVVLISGALGGTAQTVEMLVALWPW
jgi:hypothetical protein